MFCSVSKWGLCNALIVKHINVKVLSIKQLPRDSSRASELVSESEACRVVRVASFGLLGKQVVFLCFLPLLGSERAKRVRVASSLCFFVSFSYWAPNERSE